MTERNKEAKREARLAVNEMRNFIRRCGNAPAPVCLVDFIENQMTPDGCYNAGTIYDYSPEIGDEIATLQEELRIAYENLVDRLEDLSDELSLDDNMDENPCVAEIDSRRG